MAGFKSHGITSRFYQGMEIVAMAVAIITLSSTVHAATYYVDFSGGSDTNNGTATNTAWKHHPYMVGWTGSYSHSAGDRFIFKGGVTWDKTCFPMGIALGGGSVYDYYGVTNNWFTGGAWARPIFDAQSSALGTSGANFFINMGLYENGWMIDNIEFTGLYWDSTSQGYGTSMIFIGQNTNTVIRNCLFHNWTHDTYANGCHDDLQIILGSTTIDGIGNVITNCIFDGSASGGDSGMAAYCEPVIRNCICTNMSNGFLTKGDGGNGQEVSYCTIGPINGSFDPNQHPNSIEQVGGNQVSIHHNRIFGANAVCVFVGAGASFVSYFYDNIITNSAPIPFQVDARSAPSTNYVFNNTIVAPTGFPCVRVLGTNTCLVIAQNNHFINDVAASGTRNNNLYQTLDEAIAAGYTYANNFAPASASSPTVDRGVSKSSLFNTDILGVSRPQGAAWDIGAYEYMAQGGGAAAISVVPVGLNFGSVMVGTNADQTLTVQNTGTGTLSGSASVAAPFSIISGGAYTLSPDQSQAVTVRLTPTASGSNSQTMSFSGGSGTTATVSGVGWPCSAQNLHVAAAGP